MIAQLIARLLRRSEPPCDVSDRAEGRDRTATRLGAADTPHGCSRLNALAPDVIADARPHVERAEPSLASPPEPPVGPGTAPSAVGPRPGGSARREGTRAAGRDLDGVPPMASACPATGGSGGEGTEGDRPPLSVGGSPRTPRSAKRYRHQIRLNEQQERIVRRLAAEAGCCVNTACSRILVDALREIEP